jgi:hypothetical protein
MFSSSPEPNQGIGLPWLAVSWPAEAGTQSPSVRCRQFSQFFVRGESNEKRREREKKKKKQNFQTIRNRFGIFFLSKSACSKKRLAVDCGEVLLL